MVRLLADENFPFPVTEALRRTGHDVLTLSDLGLAGQALTDDAVLDLAARDERAVLTLNRKDFVRLHRDAVAHAGIIVCTLDLDFDGQAERVRNAIGARSSLTGELLRVNREAGGHGAAASDRASQ